MRDPDNDNVTAIDTYNDPNVRNNIQDATQDVTLFNSSFINGTISCTYVLSLLIITIGCVSDSSSLISQICKANHG